MYYYSEIRHGYVYACSGLPRLWLISEEIVGQTNLRSSASQHVVPLWKDIISSKLETKNLQADLDCLISGDGDLGRPGYICRKCFYVYEKVLKAQSEIKSRITKVIDVIVLRRVPVLSCTTSASHVRASGKRVASSSISAPAPKRRPPPPIFVCQSLQMLR